VTADKVVELAGVAVVVAPAAGLAVLVAVALPVEDAVVARRRRNEV
jgi:hypothetical protein